jgi:hypothetical protein
MIVVSGRLRQQAPWLDPGFPRPRPIPRMQPTNADGALLRSRQHSEEMLQNVGFHWLFVAD